MVTAPYRMRHLIVSTVVEEHHARRIRQVLSLRISTQPSALARNRQLVRERALLDRPGGVAPVTLKIGNDDAV